MVFCKARKRDVGWQIAQWQKWIVDLGLGLIHITHCAIHDHRVLHKLVKTLLGELEVRQVVDLKGPGTITVLQNVDTVSHVEQQSSGCGRVSDVNAGSIHSGQITHLPAQSRAGFHKIRLLPAPFKAPGDLVENLVPGAQIADRLCHRNDLVEVEAVRLNC